MRHGNAAVCHHDHQSRKLSLKLVYQLTHKTMICRSKCRPLNRSSIGTNRCISSSSPHPRVCTRAVDPTRLIFVGLHAIGSATQQLNFTEPRCASPVNSD